MPLRQTEPGIFASAGPQQYEFLPTLDLDADGVPDSQDECPATVLGDVVDSFGCSIAQYVPCAGPLEGTPWKNRGQFMTALMATTQMFETLGLINSRQRIEIITAAARSTCGK